MGRKKKEDYVKKENEESKEVIPSVVKVEVEKTVVPYWKSRSNK